MNINAVGVYAIVNIVSGGIYIGSTGRGFEIRWREHIYELSNNRRKRTHFQHAWNKYGKSAFEFLILEYVSDTSKLVEREQYWLDYHRTLVKVYNLATEVKNSSSKDSRRRLSKTLKGHIVSQETCRKLSEANKGKKHSEETKRKIGNASRGRKHTKEAKRRMSEAKKGKKFSDEHIHNLTMALRGRKMPPLSDKHKRKIGDANRVKRGYKHTEETRQKMSKAGGKYYPSFLNKNSDELIPEGINLTAMCREHRLDIRAMDDVKNGRRSEYKGWVINE